LRQLRNLWTVKCSEVVEVGSAGDYWTSDLNACVAARRKQRSQKRPSRDDECSYLFGGLRKDIYGCGFGRTERIGKS
jgi:hypothetical protein